MVTVFVAILFILFIDSFHIIFISLFDSQEVFDGVGDDFLNQGSSDILVDLHFHVTFVFAFIFIVLFDLNILILEEVEETFILNLLGDDSLGIGLLVLLGLFNGLNSKVLSFLPVNGGSLSLGNFIVIVDDELLGEDLIGEIIVLLEFQEDGEIVGILLILVVDGDDVLKSILVLLLDFLSKDFTAQ